jgi:nitrite reductase (NAD(P)H)
MPEGSLSYHLNTIVTEIDSENKTVKTGTANIVPYDTLVLATGSDAVLPKHTPGHDANGVFVYRTINDLERLIEFAATRKGTTGAVVGGGLLGLEAAKAMMDLEDFGKVKLIERNRWVLSRQLDGDAGGMVVEQVRSLGLDVMLSKRVGRINTDENKNVVGVVFEDGEKMDCSCICFAVRYMPFNILPTFLICDRLASKHGMNWLEKLASSVLIAAVVSSSSRTWRPQSRTSTPLANAPAGRTRPLA